MGFKKYRQYPIVKNINRQWPNNTITKAPTYCAVDLRDGNQALINPLTIEQKTQYFMMLVKMGFKQIEISYPSASHTDFMFTRKLIEDNLIPDDVYIQVLIPSKKEHIIKSVEAMRGAKKAIFHLYNPTSKFQREVVFQKSDKEIINMAVESMQLLKDLTSTFQGIVKYEYTPESFSQTNLTFAAEICNAVINVIKPTKKNKVIINLANTLEACSANIYADRIEWMCNHLNDINYLEISVHPHNDRGTAVSSAEMAILAGASRVEGTLFGNGERAGNVDLVTLAFNIYSQGINPTLDLSFIDDVKIFVEDITSIKTHIRHPYVGDMIFTAFSGGHQDAINKGMQYYEESLEKNAFWNVPYLLIDPKDINRDYRNIIRINSQSGKGGVSFIIKEFLNINISKQRAIEFGKKIKLISDKNNTELSAQEIISLYKVTYKNESNDWDANIYNQHASFVSNLAMPVVELLNPQQNEHILDLGCGDGTLANEIQKYGAHVIAIDTSDKMVEKAKKNGIEAYKMDVTNLEFKSQFDAVFSNAVLHWVKTSKLAIQQVHKVLRTDGRFIAEFGGYENIQSLINAMENVFKKNEDFGKFINPWYFPKKDEYKQLLETNGFIVKEINIFKRATKIDDINNWLDIFANGIVSHLTNSQKKEFKKQVRTILKPILYTNQNGWVIDYVRLRVKAVKQ